MAGAKKTTTIREHIEKELTRIKKTKLLYEICNALDKDIQKLIKDVDDHLTKIQEQMPDYDKHDASHSERVLSLIEQLLGPTGISNMPFLEAELLLLCCHFHDTGMAVPDWCFSLLKKVEAPDFVWHKNRDEVLTALHAPNSGWSPAKAYNQIKELFLVPRKESDYYEWLADEIWTYELYRQGLEPWDEMGDREQWVCETREEHLRSTHGERSGNYANHIGKALSSLSKYSAIQKKLAYSVGGICSAHTKSVDAVWKLVGLVTVNPGLSDDALTYNPEFLSMLLRLGDVLDFSEDRASRTLYVEHNPMNRTSDKHWLAKSLTGLAVEIKSPSGKEKQIRFMGSFPVPDHYYFIHDYLNWADDELENYARFLNTMERDSAQKKRYSLSLPSKTDRTNVEADEFTPDHELRFTLEQRRVIDLLMGTRLYSDKFTCLRELYQNALDASRCMRAENLSKGVDEQLPIVFGIETDEESGRKFLYCRDRGIGMTKDTVKNYLLKAGNSYYRSAQFRRDNTLWGNAVHPVSGFGIGLLSCYIIGDRLEILTRHCKEDQAFWICMESTENYGYFREIPQSLRDRLGEHGTEVRVFLKDTYLKEITDELPESREAAEDAIALTGSLGRKVLPLISFEALQESQTKCLWYRLQNVICIPETDFPVSVYGTNGNRYILEQTQARYPLESRIDHIQQKWGSVVNPTVLQTVGAQLELVPVSFTDSVTGSEARTWLCLPICPTVSKEMFQFIRLIYPIGFSFCVDGLATKADAIWDALPHNICWNWKSTARPMLSVNREEVSELPSSFHNDKKRLLTGLYREIDVAISRHFVSNPAADSPEARSFLLRFLWAAFKIGGNISCMAPLHDLWFALSTKSFSSHIECGFPMSAIHDGTHCFSLLPSDLSTLWRRNENHLEGIASAILLRAKRIRLDVNQIKVEMGENTPNIDWEQPVHGSLLYVAEPDGQSWENWDIHSDFLPFVSPALFQCLAGNTIGTGFGKGASLPSVLRCSALLTTTRKYDSIRDKALPQLKNNGWALSNQPERSTIKVSNGMPLLLVYIAPAMLTEETEREIQLYDAVPAYRDGVSKGWTILLFPITYNKPYYMWILAPGVMDRHEMARHIPKKIVEEAAAAGYPLHFSDGTPAFPKS